MDKINEEVQKDKELTVNQGLEPRLTLLEGRVAKLDGKTAEEQQLEARLTALERRVEKLDGKTAEKQQLEARITALEDRVTKLEENHPKPNKWVVMLKGLFKISGRRSNG